MSFNTIIDWNGCSADQQQQLLTRPAISASDSISKTVTEILNNVKANGDAALREYSAKFDKTTVAALQVSEAEIAAAGERLSDELKQAMAVAVNNIEGKRYRTEPNEKKAGGFPPAFLNHITLRLTPRLRTAAPGCGSFWSRRLGRPDRYRPRSGPESSSSLPG